MASEYTWETTGTQVVRDLADQIRGKTILVTGVTPNGLGAKFSELIAGAGPAIIILAGRNTAKSNETARTIAAANPAVETKTLEVDLSSLASVRRAAETVSAWDDVPHIDVLVNNAGIMAVDFELTEDGFERDFATNHLGPFLFTNLILGKVMASASPRVVVVSSSGHRFSPIRWWDYNYTKWGYYNKWAAYGQSKTANNLFAIALAEKLGPKALQAYSVHPGAISTTNLGNHLGGDLGAILADLRAQDAVMGCANDAEPQLKTDDQGVATHIYASFASDISGHNGEYLLDCRVADPFKNEVWSWGASKVDAERLWQLSEELVGQQFKY